MTTSPSTGMRTKAPGVRRLISSGPTRAIQTSKKASSVVMAAVTARSLARTPDRAGAVSPGPSSGPAVTGVSCEVSPPPEVSI